MNHFQSITTNLSLTVRKDEMEGRDYLVVPTASMTTLRRIQGIMESSMKRIRGKGVEDGHPAGSE